MKALTQPVRRVVSELLEPRWMMALTYGNNGQPWPIASGQISWVEAENFDQGGQGVGYNDTTTANQGGQYRLTEGVDIEGPSANAGGTYRTSYAAAGEWQAYTIDVQQAGQYQLRLRAAAAGTGGTARVRFDGVDKTGVINVTSTGGWDTWQNFTATVDLPAGVQVMRAEVVGGSFNTDYISLQPIALVGGREAYGVRGLPTLLPAWGSQRIEAENFDTGGQGVAYFEVDPNKLNTATLNGQPFRPTDLVETSNRGTGIAVNQWAAGDWIEHTVYASSAGVYEMRISYAKGDTVATNFLISVNGTQQVSIPIPTTGDWYGFKTLPTSLTLAAGKNIIRFLSNKGQVNLDYYDLRRSQTFGNNNQAWSVPASGAVRIEAENFDVTPTGVTDLTPGNSGDSTYRAGTDADLRTIPGGVALTGVQAGESVEYSILAAVDGYNLLRLRYASVTDQQVRVKFDGTDRTGVLTLPATGSADTFVTFEKKILFKAGDQVMRIEPLSAGLNLDWTELEKVTTTPIVQVGGGSYASEPPDVALSNNPGLFDRVYDKTYDWVNRPANSAVPTNDWWTAILEDQFAGGLWAYPMKLTTGNTGVSFTTYNSFGTSSSNINYGTGQSLSIGAASGTFTRDALVNYGDWTVKFRMEQTASQYVDVTMGRGLPYAWFEFSSIFVPKLNVGGTFSAFSPTGSALGTTFTADAFRISKGGQEFGVFAPAGTTFTLANGNYSVNFSGAQRYLVVAALPDATQPTFALFQDHAYAVPRNSRYDWTYDVDAGAVSTTWNMTTELLMAGKSDQVIQGWLPHNYRDVLTAPTLLPGYQYLSINGPIKLSVGNSTTIVQPTNGIAFTLAAPKSIGGAGDFDVAKMRSYLASYAAGDASVPNYGNDTYFGGKALQQFAEFALMAKQLNDPTYATFLSALRTSVTDWFTYTPGEQAHYFAAYPRDGALIGFQPSFGSQNFTDNHFHYGYHTSAAGVLSLLDPAWASSFGQMAKLVAKQYGNWDRTDTAFPYLRTFEPWIGHSYAGGTGDARGNNQESTSEAIQSWLGIALLGQALSDPSMTAAGIMGYTIESKAELEYWFDAPHGDLFPATYDKSNVAIKYDDSHSYGTFFGAQPEYILGIEGLPLWPSLDFLGRYPQPMIDSVNSMLQQRNVFYNNTTSNTWSSFETTNANDWLNINLGILGQADPQAAASEYARMISQNTPTSRINQTGLYYYNIHSYRTYGKRDYTLHLSLPLGGVYKNPTTGLHTYVVTNPSTTPQRVYVRDANGVAYGSFIASAQDTTVYEEQANKAPTINTPAAASPDPVPGTTASLGVLGADDAGESNLSYAWQLLTGPAPVTFDQNNSNAAKNTLATFTKAGAYSFRVTITDAGGLRVTSDLAITVNSTLTTLNVTPNPKTVGSGAQASFSATTFDQFGDAIPASIAWSVPVGGGSIDTDGLYTAPYAGGSATVRASAGALVTNVPVTITNAAPTFTAPAGASPASVTGNQTTLSSLATDDAGAANLSYAWTLLPGAPAGVTFANGTGTGPSVGVTFARVGTYQFRVTVSDLGGLTNVSDVTVNVLPTVTSVVVSPSSTSVKRPATAQFSASVFDQFGSAMVAPVTWGVTGATNSISTNGLLTPGTTSGPFVVSAGTSGVTGTATVNVDASIFSGSTDIGAVALPGSTSAVVNDSITMTASGADIWNTADQFRYTYMPFTGDGAIVVRVASVVNTNTFAKAGVMFRETLAADSRNAGVFVTPGQGVTFQQRANTTGTTGSQKTAGLTAPQWLKLVRSGNTFSAFRGTDGVTWTNVGGVITVNMASTLYVGLALSSHTNSARTTAVFEQAKVTTPTNLALSGVTSASSTAVGSAARNAADGNTATSWLSTAPGIQTLTVDLGSVKNVNRILLNWGTTYATSFRLQWSTDGTTFTDFYSTTAGTGADLDRTSTRLNARYIRVRATAGTLGSYSIRELQVLG